MKKLSLILPRQDSFIYTAKVLFIILLLPLMFAGGATAQSVVKIYPKTIRLEKGKTKTITATAFDANGIFMPNRIYNYSVLSGNSNYDNADSNAKPDSDRNADADAKSATRAVSGSGGKRNSRRHRG